MFPREAIVPASMVALMLAPLTSTMGAPAPVVSMLTGPGGIVAVAISPETSMLLMKSRALTPPLRLPATISTMPPAGTMKPAARVFVTSTRVIVPFSA